MIEDNKIYEVLGTFECHTCSFARSIPGSAHTRCSRFSLETGLAMALHQKVPVLPMSDEDGNVYREIPLVKINPVGKKGGWATYPIDYDPIWIECHMGDAKNILPHE